MTFKKYNGEECVKFQVLGVLVSWLFYLRWRWIVLKGSLIPINLGIGALKTDWPMKYWGYKIFQFLHVVNHTDPKSQFLSKKSVEDYIAIRAFEYFERWFFLDFTILLRFLTPGDFIYIFGIFGQKLRSDTVCSNVKRRS